MSDLKAGFLTFGCKVNQYETQAMREMLIQTGYSLAEKEETPDIFIINSCTVTAESDRKTRQAVRKYRNLYPSSTLVLTGCMPQAFPEEGEALSEADIVLGNADYGKLVSAIEAHRTTGARIIEISAHERKERFSSAGVSEFHERTRAYLKIQDGCDRYCTYCIIPKARGCVRSKPLEAIKTEISELAERYSEVVLVGINLTSYGKDIGLTICDAIEAAAKNDKIKRIRIGSIEPDRLPAETLERLATCEKLCPHFHLSLQSGAETTLRRMNRQYTAAEYADLCANIRRIFTDCAITTDIMVGFPGETEEEFAESLEFVKKISFARSHIFAYSRRKGTPAAKMENQISNSVKSERSKKMMAATHSSAEAFLQNMIGKTVSVLLETSDGGYTPNYTYVHVKADRTNVGRLLNVKITGIKGNDAAGELLESN